MLGAGSASKPSEDWYGRHAAPLVKRLRGDPIARAPELAAAVHDALYEIARVRHYLLERQAGTMPSNWWPDLCLDVAGEAHNLSYILDEVGTPVDPAPSSGRNGVEPRVQTFLDACHEFEEAVAAGVAWESALGSLVAATGNLIACKLDGQPSPVERR